jgi:hypothetical protein
VNLKSLRGSALALIAAAAAWAGGCATAPAPLIDPALASGAYTPTRIALMPPDVFVVLDQVGDNDAVRSAALGQAVSTETVRVVEQSLRARGYDVDLSARWDGIVARDGGVLVSRDELGWLANGILQFGNSPDGAGHGPLTMPRYVAPELAAKVGWATQSDALLYVNVKGVTTTGGKRAESILAGVFIVFVVAAIILVLVASSKGGGSSGQSSSLTGGGFRGQSVARAPSPAATGGWRGAPVAATSGGHAAIMPSGGGAAGVGHAAGMPSANAGGVGRAASMPSGNGGVGRAAIMPSGNGGVSRAAIMPSGGAAPTPGGWRGAAPAGGVAAGGGGWRGGAAPPRPVGAPVYFGGPRVSFGVGIIVPLDGPVYTHDGDVEHEDEMFAGDELYVSMTLVSTYDGRVLWHARDSLDLDADDNADVDRMVQTFLGSLPPRGGMPAPAPRK